MRGSLIQTRAVTKHHSQLGTCPSRYSSSVRAAHSPWPIFQPRHSKHFSSAAYTEPSLATSQGWRPQIKAMMYVGQFQTHPETRTVLH